MQSVSAVSQSKFLARLRWAFVLVLGAWLVSSCAFPDDFSADEVDDVLSDTTDPGDTTDTGEPGDTSDTTDQDTTGQDTTGQDTTDQDTTGQDTTGQDTTDTGDTTTGCVTPMGEEACDASDLMRKWRCFPMDGPEVQRCEPLMDQPAECGVWRTQLDCSDDAENGTDIVVGTCTPPPPPPMGEMHDAIDFCVDVCPDTAVCADGLQPGDAICVGNDLQACGVDAQGCPAPTQQSCGADLCLTPDLKPAFCASCVPGEQRCDTAGGALETCELNATGDATEWVAVQCGPNEACVEGSLGGPSCETQWESTTDYTLHANLPGRVLSMAQLDNKLGIVTVADVDATTQICVLHCIDVNSSTTLTRLGDDPVAVPCAPGLRMSVAALPDWFVVSGSPATLVSASECTKPLLASTPPDLEFVLPRIPGGQLLIGLDLSQENYPLIYEIDESGADPQLAECVAGTCPGNVQSNLLEGAEPLGTTIFQSVINPNVVAYGATDGSQTEFHRVITGNASVPPRLPYNMTRIHGVAGGLVALSGPDGYLVYDDSNISDIVQFHTTTEILSATGSGSGASARTLGVDTNAELVWLDPVDDGVNDPTVDIVAVPTSLTDVQYVYTVGNRVFVVAADGMGRPVLHLITPSP